MYRRARSRRHRSERDICKDTAFSQPVRDGDNKLATANLQNWTSYAGESRLNRWLFQSVIERG